MKKKRLIRYLTILQICILLGLGSYAWFADRSSPSISQNNFRVTSAEGLNIRLGIDTVNRTTVNLNELFTDFNEFQLKQVSSANAVNFYTIDFGAGLTYTQPRYIELLPDEFGQIDMINYGYIDHTFYLQTEDFGKHVYFHNETDFNGVSSDAMRISLTWTIDGLQHTLIFGEEKENSSVGFTTHAVIATGSFTYGTYPPELIGNQTVYLFSDYDGGRNLNDSDPINLTKTLFTIPANTVVPLNLKIWLEGGDEDCDNSLADTSLDVLIKLGSANQLLDPPNVSANNQFMTITGLTTAMEYSLDGVSYTPVTTTSVAFLSGQTVYVRIAEVLGVSPMSHPAVVVFN